jgi:hypothetical protein
MHTDPDSELAALTLRLLQLINSIDQPFVCRGAPSLQRLVNEIKPLILSCNTLSLQDSPKKN